MFKQTKLLVALSLFFVACSDDGSILPDSSTADTSVDVPVADTQADAPTPDTAVSDSADDLAADLAVDSAVQDLSPPDQQAIDMTSDVVSDLPATDVGSQTCTVTPNSCSNGEVCLGESCSCILKIHGGHYLRSNGTVVHWNSGSSTVITVAGGAELTGVTDIFSGSAHGCALRNDNTVWCWPTSFLGNASGQLGNGAVVSNTPSQNYYIATQVLLSAGPTPLTNVAHINGGSSRGYLASNSCAILQDETLWCWGSPDSSGGGGGTLFNDGVAGNRPYATQILGGPGSGLSGVQAVSIGTRHACVIRNGATNNEVWCWGANVGGPLGQGNRTGQTYPVQVTLPAQADQIAAGADATCARLGDAVYCWGSNNTGQLGIGDHTLPTNTDNPPCPNFCKLTPRQVVDQNDVPLTGITDLNMGYLSTCATRNDHSLWCWGSITAVGQSDWAIPAVVGGNTLTNIAQHTTYNNSGYSQSMLYLTRDDVLAISIGPVTQVCP